MSDVILKLCPACNQDVEYEEIDEQLYCSICGRSQKTAEEFLIIRKKKSRMKNFKLIGWVLAAIFVLIRLTTDSGKVTSIATIAIAIPTVLIVYLGHKLINRKNKKVEGDVKPLEVYKEYTKYK